MTELRLRADLPVPVARYLEAAWHGKPTASPTTLVMEGNGRVRIRPLPWLPVEVGMYHRLGHDYVGLFRMRLAGLTVLRVIDAYVDGAGLTKIGPAATIGPAIDQGAFLGMWAAALAYPSTWDQVRWEPLDDDAAIAVLSFDGAPLPAVVRFDPETRYPTRFEADRFKGGSGRKVRWYGDSSDWRVMGGLPFPSRVSAWWTDEEFPWFELRVTATRADAPIDGPMDAGRRAIADARSKRAG